MSAAGRMSATGAMMHSTVEIPPVYGFPDLPESWDACALLVDKPKGITSFGVVRRIRSRVPVRKVGHAGTLDPMATGLLIILVGKATKRMEDFMGLPKEYEGMVRLGQTTASFDAETEVEASVGIDHLTDKNITEKAGEFEGDIQQRPPIFSAIKVGGERLYRKARRGESVEIPMRTVSVTRFATGPRVDRDVAISVSCSKGTYVRSLANDLGAALGVGGHLVALRRTAIGPYRVSAAWPFDELCAQLEKAE
jgi:tRNA pseudouridine55 synthase